MVVITEYFIEQTFPKMAGIILSDPVSFFFMQVFLYSKSNVKNWIMLKRNSVGIVVSIKWQNQSGWIKSQARSSSDLALIFLPLGKEWWSHLFPWSIS